MQQRFVLFLQGPSSPFMSRVASEVAARGHSVRRINLCPGDRWFWRAGGNRWYRGRLADWPAFVENVLRDDSITDLVLLGDGRPYQSRAISVARRLGIRIHAIEHGYIRPDWITVERDGLSSFSRFPQEAAAIRALAAGRPLPDTAPIERESFLRYASWDVQYHVANMASAWLLTPHYQRYMIDHPLVEYAGWIRKLATSRRSAAVADRIWSEVAPWPGPLFLMPLQLPTDYQIRVHSPFPAFGDAVDWVIASFAAQAPADALLLLKVHPLDNSLGNWPDRIAAAAVAHGLGQRLRLIDGGPLDPMIARAAGVVTVNSTVGLTALKAGRPVAVLGNAVYDVDGLVDRRPLADFWSAPQAPDMALMADFLKALAWATQVRGEFTAPEAMRIGAINVAERILEAGDRLPPGPVQEAGQIAFRRAGEWRAAMAGLRQQE